MSNWIKKIRILYYFFKKPDSVGMAPIKLQIEPVNNCNLKCLSCCRADLVVHSEIMPYGNFIKIIDEVKPIYITLSGLGESLLNPEIDKMIKYCTDRRIFVSSITNGILLGNFYNKLCDANLDQLSISLDSASKETYLKIRKSDYFDLIVGNIKSLVKYKKKNGLSKPFVRISFLVQQGNINELNQFIKLCGDMGVEEAHFQPLLLVGVSERKNDLVGSLNKSQIIEKLKFALIFAKSCKVKNNLSEVLGNLDIYWRQYDYDVNNINLEVCLNPWYDAFIDVHGNFKPCCNFSWNPNSTNFGNVISSNFMDCYNSKKYSYFRQDIKAGKKPFKECVACNPVGIKTMLKWAKGSIYR